MPKSADILEERKALFTKMEELRDKPELTQEDWAEFRRMDSEFEELGERAQLAARQEGRQGVLEPEERKAEVEGAENRGKAPAHPGSVADVAEEFDSNGERVWRQKTMRDWLQGKAGFDERALASLFEKRSASSLPAGMERRDLTQGGLGTIQTTLAPSIVGILDNVSAIRRLSEVITTNDTGAPITLYVEGTPPAANYTAEGAAYTNNDPTLSPVTLSSFKVDNLSKISEELVFNSSYDIEAKVAELVGRGIGLKQAAWYATGTGTNQPRGAFSSGAITSGLTTGTSGTITWQELSTLMGAVPAQYNNDQAAWVMHPTTIAYVRTLTTGTAGFPVFSPATGGADALDRIFGKPVYADSNAPAFASGNMAIIFGDWSRGYAVRESGGLQVKVLMERYADTGQIGVIGKQYVDGKPLDPGALRSLTVKP